MRAPLQFVLDFFTGGDPVMPVPHRVAPTNLAGGAVTTPNPPAEPRATHPTQPQDLSPSHVLPEPSGFTHPAANRHAVLHGMTVSFLFERSRRRSIGFMVGAEGLVVRAPSWVTLREVDAAVQEKGAWIVAKLQQAKQRQTEQFQKAIEWRHGAEVPFMGRTVQLCVLERGVGRVQGDRAGQDGDSMKFRKKPVVIDAIKVAGYPAPTSVQQKVIPLVLQGRDVIAQAKTGTGKTAIAFQVAWKRPTLGWPTTPAART